MAQNLSEGPANIVVSHVKREIFFKKGHFLVSLKLGAGLFKKIRPGYNLQNNMFLLSTPRTRIISNSSTRINNGKSA